MVRPEKKNLFDECMSTLIKEKKYHELDFFFREINSGRKNVMKIAMLSHKGFSKKYAKKRYLRVLKFSGNISGDDVDEIMVYHVDSPDIQVTYQYGGIKILCLRNYPNCYNIEIKKEDLNCEDIAKEPSFWIEKCREMEIRKSLERRV